MSTLRVAEIFYSVQCEGAQLGAPAVFLRLSGCLLSCKFCDTKYALQGGREEPLEKIAKQLNALFKKHQHGSPRHLIITGGEPMLQRAALAELIPMLHYVAPRGSDPATKASYVAAPVIVEIETTGILPPDDLAEGVEYWNISPKTVVSNRRRVVTKLNLAYLGLGVNGVVSFKFVVNNHGDAQRYALWVEQHLQTYLHENVYFMPQAQTREEYLRKAPLVIELCKKYGFRFSPREHIVLFDMKRGV